MEPCPHPRMPVPTTLHPDTRSGPRSRDTGSGPCTQNTHTSLTRIQLFGGCTELGILCDSVSDIRTFGRSPCGTETCCLCYSIRQVVEI